MESNDSPEIVDRGRHEKCPASFRAKSNRPIRSGLLQQAMVAKVVFHNIKKD